MAKSTSREKKLVEPQAGHAIDFDQPEAVLEVIGAFLVRLDSSMASCMRRGDQHLPIRRDPASGFIFTSPAILMRSN